MAIFTYDEYIHLIPSETSTFLSKLFSYAYHTDIIDLGYRSITNDNDKFLYKALRAYEETNEKNRNFLRTLGFNSNVSLYSSSLYDDTKKKLFSEYYDVLTPFSSDEEYLTLLPEDIIISIIKRRFIGPDYDYRTLSLLPYDRDKLFEILKGIAKSQKELMLNEYNKKFNKDFSISVINYFDMVGKMYAYLRKNKRTLENVETNEDGLKNLAMVLAIFYYNHVSSYNDSYNEQKIIIDYFASKGLTIDDIKKKINLAIDKKDLEKIDSTLILTKYFSKFRIPDIQHSSYTVGLIVNKLINNGIDDTLQIRKILGLFDVTIAEVGSINEELKRHKDELNNNNLEQLYQGLLPNVISYLKRIAKIYTYLLTKKENLEQSLVYNDKDLYLIAVLLSSYEFKNKLNTFFSEKGVTIDKVLELLKLPPKDEYIKELSQVEAQEKNMSKYYKLIHGGVNYNKRKEQITVESIVDNIVSRDRTESSIVHKIFIAIANEKLDDDFTDQISKYLKNKENARKKELTEKLLNNISIDVYNFLKTLCSYYKIFKEKKLTGKDLEQLSIICAASRHDKSLEKYLESFDMKRVFLARCFGIEFAYQESKLDIDIIANEFAPYIFDRPNEEITVYSIFENAFKPELTNTLLLRKALDNFSKKPEDFFGIEEKIAAFEKEEQEKLQIEQEENLLKKCDDITKKVILDAMRIHEYLSTSGIKSPYLKTIEDIEELAILIAIFINDEDYIPFFVHNGITLDEILTEVGLDKKIIKEIRMMNVDKKLIFNYEKYLQGEAVSLKTIISSLFDDSINSSKILENITEATGNNYSFLMEEVSSQKERNLTPDQGIIALGEEEVKEITDSSITSIVDYGTSISKHSKYINDALHELIFEDTLEHSLDDINVLLNEISYEERIEPEKKQSFFERLLDITPTPQVIKKYNPEKIGDLEQQVDLQIEILSKELKGYEAIKKYIEVYLKKLQQYLNYLKMYNASLKSEQISDDLDEITKFTKTLDQNSSREIMRDKINTFETIILLMKQTLVTVHRSIINHFITINSLQTSKSAILPLLATEIAINIGKDTERESLELTSNLVNLLGSVVNKNNEATKENLEKLKLSSLSDETYNALNSRITMYLESSERGDNLIKLEEEKLQPNDDTLHLDPPQKSFN